MKSVNDIPISQRRFIVSEARSILVTGQEEEGMAFYISLSLINMLDNLIKE